MIRSIAAILIGLGVVGMWNSFEATVTNSMKAYALQDSDAASQNGLWFLVWFATLFAGAILLEVARRKK